MNGKLAVLNVIQIFLSVVVVYVSATLDHRAELASKLLRDTRVELQRINQSISLLENPDYQPMIKSLGTSLSDLKIDISEYVSDQGAALGVSDMSYQLDIREASILPNDRYPISLIRLKLNLRADNVGELASILQGIRTTVSPWPIEARACDIQRLVADRLLVRCVVDIYYWGDYA